MPVTTTFATPNPDDSDAVSEAKLAVIRAQYAVEDAQLDVRSATMQLERAITAMAEAQRCTATTVEVRIDARGTVNPDDLARIVAEAASRFR